MLSLSSDRKLVKIIDLTWSRIEQYEHCPKHNLSLCIKTEPITVEVYRCKSICLVSEPHICKQKPDIYCCIRSSRDRLGYYAKIQIIFGTVYMAESSLPPTASLLVFHCTVVFVSYNSVMHKVGLFVYPTTNTLTSYDWGAVS